MTQLGVTYQLEERRDLLTKFSKICSNRPFVYFLSFEVLTVGAWLEASSFKGAFERAGASLTLLALFVLWLWLKSNDRLGFDRRVIDGLANVPELSNQDGLETMAKRAMTNIPSLSAEGAYEMVTAVHILKTQGPAENARQEKKVIGLGYVQIEIAAIGTAVWAYGGLFPSWHYLPLLGVVPLLVAVVELVKPNQSRTHQKLT